jgi:hypothetical protein
MTFQSSDRINNHDVTKNPPVVLNRLLCWPTDVVLWRCQACFLVSNNCIERRITRTVTWKDRGLFWDTIETFSGRNLETPRIITVWALVSWPEFYFVESIQFYFVAVFTNHHNTFFVTLYSRYIRIIKSVYSLHVSASEAIIRCIQQMYSETKNR